MVHTHIDVPLAVARPLGLQMIDREVILLEREHGHNHVRVVRLKNLRTMMEHMVDALEKSDVALSMSREVMTNEVWTECESPRFECRLVLREVRTGEVQFVMPEAG